MTAPAGEHTVQRPSWDCGHCDEPWPCVSARETLSAELDQVSLAMYMDTHLAESLGDLPAAPPDELFDRFLGWARRDLPGWR